MFTRDEMRTWLLYAGAALAAFLGGMMTYVIPLLLDPTEPAISVRVLMGTGLSAVIGAGISTRITRPGKEAVSAQVRALQGKAGVDPRDMVVIPSVNSDVSIQDATAANPRIQEAAHPPTT